MPKINVYLPDELAAAVREAGLSVSPICQRALSEAVRSVSVAREAIDVLRAPGAEPEQLRLAVSRIAVRMTPRFDQALRRAAAIAGEARKVTPNDLLVGLLDVPDNLGAQVLTALHVEVDAVRVAAARRRKAGRSVGNTSTPAIDDATSVVAAMGSTGRMVIAGSLECALELGNDNLGSDHLLLGLVAAEETNGGGPLTVSGVTAQAVREAIPIVGAAASLGRRDVGLAFTPVGVERFTVIEHRLDLIERRLAEGGL